MTVVAIMGSQHRAFFFLFPHFVFYREQLAPGLDGLMGLKRDSVRGKDITGFSSCLVRIMISERFPPPLIQEGQRCLVVWL